MDWSVRYDYDFVLDQEVEPPAEMVNGEFWAHVGLEGKENKTPVGDALLLRLKSGRLGKDQDRGHRMRG